MNRKVREPRSVWGICEEPRSEDGWAWYLRRRIRSGEGKWVLCILWRVSFGCSSRLNESEERIVDAAFAIATVNVCRDNICASIICGRLKSA